MTKRYTPGQIVATDLVYWGIAVDDSQVPTMLIADYKLAKGMAELAGKPLVRTYITVHAIQARRRPPA
jgi:hypothetical protein